MHRQTVGCAEIDRLLEKGERYRRARDVQNDGVAHMRNGDAVADGCRSRRFTSEKQVQQEIGIHAFRKRQDPNESLQRQGFGSTGSP